MVLSKSGKIGAFSTFTGCISKNKGIQSKLAACSARLGSAESSYLADPPPIFVAPSTHFISTSTNRVFLRFELLEEKKYC